MSDDYPLARLILETTPLVMHIISADLRQSDHQLALAHFRVLWILDGAPHGLSELAERQSVSLPTMSNSITILEERGWVRRTRSAEDRRKVLIEITPEGHEVLEDSRLYAEERVNALIASMPPADQEKVSVGLRILRETFIQIVRSHSSECSERKT